LAEKFSFLKGRQIHQAIRLAQEGFHTIHSRNLKAVAYKVYLSKSFDRVSWMYIEILLIHLGFSHNFVTWILNCLITSSFAHLINKVASPLFK
jgi:hypothetical protein